VIEIRLTLGVNGYIIGTVKTLGCEKGGNNDEKVY